MPPPPHGPHANFDQMQDEEVLRFAPPEIRRIWKKLLSVEEQVGEMRQALARIEELLKNRPGGG